jgi:FkbM family methyltransferase
LVGREGATVSLSLPGVAAPILLRRKSADRIVFFQIFMHREYDAARFEQDRRLSAAYAAALASGTTPLIIDCGANIGLASIFFAGKYPRARIYAIEPDAGNYALLEENARPYPNITPLRGAVWDRKAELAIEDESAGAAAFRVVEQLGAAASEPIRAYSLSEIMTLAGASRILLAKIDIEGAESELFRSNTGWLESTEALAIELHDWMLPGRATSRNFLRALAAYPFEIAVRRETLFCFRIPKTP